jgi:hypothetical protein
VYGFALVFASRQTPEQFPRKATPPHWYYR